MPDLFTFRGVYLPTGPESPGTSLTLRVRGDPEQARQALLERLTSVDPGLGAINTMRTIAGMQTSILRIAFWVTVVLGGLALVLTVSGLFSVLSYVVEQRAKEIGVRMALGATTRNVVGAGAVAIAPPGRHRSRGRRRPGRGAGDRPDGDARRLGRSEPSSMSSIPWRTPRACWSSSRRACWPRRFPPCAPPASIRSRRSERTEPRHGARSGQRTAASPR